MSSPQQPAPEGIQRARHIAKDLLEGAINEHPAEGIAVLKNLTGIIAQRLRCAYRALVPETQADRSGGCKKWLQFLGSNI
jgi:hypothetical protein